MRPEYKKQPVPLSTLRPLVASSLVASGLLQLALPVVAQTAPNAGSGIVNEASATYEDPTNPNNPINTISNKVTITVAKVAGITVESKGLESYTGTANTPSNEYKPNDTVYAKFDVTNKGNDKVKINVPKLADVSSNVTFNEVQYKDSTNPNADANGWVTVTATNGATSQVINIDAKLEVRVKLTINSNAVKDSDIVVTLGNTQTVGDQNVARGQNGQTNDQSKDIYTVDIGTADGAAIDGAAENGTREASATQSVKVQASKQPVVNISLTPNPTSTTQGSNVAYTVKLDLDPTDPGSGQAAADLAPTAIQLSTNADGSSPTSKNHVIVSTAIPSGSKLESNPTPPTNWSVIYKTTDSNGTWTTVAPTSTTDRDKVTEIAFIYTENTNLPISAYPLSTDTTDFSFTLKANTAGTLSNVATVYGKNADNLTQSIQKDSSATVAVTTTSTQTTNLYNGPASFPRAIGPGNDNNADFTNKSIVISTAAAKRTDGTNLDSSNAGSATFINEVENDTNAPRDVYILPTAPSTIGDLPNNTEVTIRNINGTETRTYRYNNTTGAYTFVSSSTTTTTPLKLTIGANGTMSYQVEVSLPSGQTQLKGYPVPLTAFNGGTVTNNMVALPGSGIVAQNTTINRVYTGYLDVRKEVRVLDTLSQQNDSESLRPYSASPTVRAVPGKYIQYRIKYTNKSETATTGGGSNNAILEASKVKITEDGNALPNNWGNTTKHEPGTAKTFNNAGGVVSSAIDFFNGGAASTDSGTVTKYVVDLGTTNKIAPQESGSFTFIRQVNAPDPRTWP